MQKILDAKNKKNISLLMGVLTFGFLMLPDATLASEFVCGVSGGGQGDVFSTIACKVTTSLADIRKIVYVLAGFGLIAFAFAAIFNKISFKHLGTIAFSLFLLSMITPFVEYFTQEPGVTLKYGHYLSSDFTSQDDALFGECGDNCPKADIIESKGVPMIDEETVEEEVLGEREVLEPIAPLDIGFVPVSALGEDGLSGIGNLPGLTGTGEIDDRTSWQKIKDGISVVVEEGVTAYNTATTVISAANDVKDAIETGTAIVENMDFSGNFLQDAKNVINAGKDLHNLTNSAGAGITSAGSAIGQNYTDGLANPDNEDAKTLGEITSNIVGVATGVTGEVNDVSNSLGRGVGAAEGVSGWFDK